MLAQQRVISLFWANFRFYRQTYHQVYFTMGLFSPQTVLKVRSFEKSIKIGHLTHCYLLR